MSVAKFSVLFQMEPVICCGHHLRETPKASYIGNNNTNWDTIQCLVVLSGRASDKVKLYLPNQDVKNRKKRKRNL